LFSDDSEDWVDELEEYENNEDRSFCNYDGDIGELDCSDWVCEDCEWYKGSGDEFYIVTTDEFNDNYEEYGYIEFVRNVIYNFKDRIEYGLIGKITLIDAEISKRVFIENENGDSFVVRYFISEQDKCEWKASYTLYKDIKNEDGSSHGEEIDSGFGESYYVWVD